MKKRGFTLIEIIGVVILLGVLALIAVPTVNIIIKNGKEKALETTIKNLEEAAYNYSNRHDIGYSSETKSIQISELKKTGYVKDETIINPVTNSELEGCILYRWDENNKQYEFNYDPECVIRDLEVNITNLDGIFNENGWAKKDFWVNIETTGTSYTYCISNKKCSPSNTISKSNGSALVVLESDNVHVCAYASYKNSTSDIKCSEIFKLDKTNPDAGTINITGTKGENEWYISTVDIAAIDGYDNLSGHLSTDVDIKTITKDTNGQKVVVTTKDKAGNESTRDYIIKVDVGDPSVTITKTVENNENVLTATTGAVVSGYSYEWYKDGKVISGETTNKLITTESGTYKLKVTTGSGKSIESNEIKINSYMITYNNNGGSGNITSTVKIEDLSVNITNDKPTRTGYTFIGWGLTDNDKEPTYVSGSTYVNNESKELFAIWKKTITIAFNANGSSLSSTKETCDMYNADKNCTITVPTITRDTFTKHGYSTNKDGVKADVTIECSDTNKKCEGIKTNVNADTTYYAITSKDVTITFNKNGAASIGSTSQSCTIKNSATNCSVTSPTITGSTNTPNVIGWDSTSPYTSNEWGVGTSKAFTDNKTYYAVTSSTQGGNNITYAITYTKSTGVSAIGKTSDSCVINASFNGNVQAQTCNIKLPTITLSAGYGGSGWYNASGTKLGNAEATISVSSNQTITAKATTITCSAGNYLAGNTTSCKQCEAGSYCSGGTYTFSSSTQGKNACPGSYTSVAGTSVITNCTITVSAGNYIATANSSTPTTCLANSYCPGGKVNYGQTGEISSCPSSHPSSAAGSDAQTDCYKTINITYAKGTGVSSIGATSGTCNFYNGSQGCNVTLPTITLSSNYGSAGWYNASGTKLGNATANISVSSSQTITAKATTITCSAGNYLAASATSCKQCEAGSWCPGGTYTFSSSTQGKTTCPSNHPSSSAGSDAQTDCYKTINITYAKGTGVSSIGTTSGTCNFYNGSQGCNVTLPTITLSSSYGSAGWYNASGTKLGNATANISVSSSQTITAKATTIACSAGNYLAASATSCKQCEAGSWCPGGTYTFSSSTQGKTTCPSIYTSSAAGSDSNLDCYLTTQLGKYIASSTASTQTTCPSGYYCPGATVYYGNTGGSSTCPSGYGTSPAGSDAASDCYKTITVTYAGNGSTSGSTASSSCNAYYNNGSCQITLRANGFTKTNYQFVGWGTGTSSVTYNAETTQSFSANTTLNAIWSESYICSTGQLTANSSLGSNSGGYVCVTGPSSSQSCYSCTYTTSVYGQDSSCGYASCPVTSTYSATPKYYCPNGGTLSGTTCSSTTYAASIKEYTCSSGTVSGSSCISYSYESSECPSSYPSKLLSSAGPIYSGVPEYACYDITSKNQCPTSYSYKNSKCYKTVAYICTSNMTTGCYSTCPSGSTNENNTCYDIIDPSCPSGYSYSNPNSSSCWNWTDVQCPTAGYTAFGDRSQCRKSVSTSATPVYYCPDGGTLNGTTCTKSSYTASVQSYSCTSSSHTLSGTTCSYSETKQDSSCGNATCWYDSSTYGYNCSECGSYTSYYCPSGWNTYSGSGSSLKCYQAATKK